VVEVPPGSNRVPYWHEIGRDDFQGQSWCAAFVTWCLRTAGVPFPSIDTPGGFVYCPDALSWGRAHGMIVPLGQQEEGDIVLYDWEHDSIPDHTGILVGAAAGSIIAIEGNTGVAGGNDGVAQATRPLTLVEAFVRPAFSEGPLPAPPSVVPVATPGIDWAAIARLIDDCKRTMLQQGSTGIAVGVLQRRLRDLGFDRPGMVDADEAHAIFGPMTRAAVIAFQAARHIGVDGIVGPQTWGTLYP
jgi:Putative peptidoglycan binding domain/CHAP domain